MGQKTAHSFSLGFSVNSKKKSGELSGWTEPSLASQKPVTVQKSELGSICLFHGPSREKLGPSQKLGPYVQPYQ
jgi:hypothetical protein